LIEFTATSPMHGWRKPGRGGRQELIEKQYAIDQAVIVAITDLTGSITYANDNFCRISGYSAANC
jgi:PAS domain-containing protein